MESASKQPKKREQTLELLPPKATKSTILQAAATKGEFLSRRLAFFF